MSAAGPFNLILIGGGARSGKSRFALDLARQIGEKRVFIATAEPLDEEMAARIARHRNERGSTYRTIEEPLALPAALLRAQGGWEQTGAPAGPDVVVVDCLTLWVSNLLGQGAGSADLRAAFDRLEDAVAKRCADVILVTNEVGLGLVPDTRLGRDFRDAIGELHQRLASTADEIYVALLGTVLRLRPDPVAAVSSTSGLHRPSGPGLS